MNTLLGSQLFTWVAKVLTNMSVVQLRQALLLAPAQLEAIRDDFVRQARFLLSR